MWKCLMCVCSAGNWSPDCCEVEPYPLSEDVSTVTLSGYDSLLLRSSQCNSEGGSEIKASPAGCCSSCLLVQCVSECV